MNDWLIYTYLFMAICTFCADLQRFRLEEVLATLFVAIFWPGYLTIRVLIKVLRWSRT